MQYRLIFATLVMAVLSLGFREALLQSATVVVVPATEQDSVHRWGVSLAGPEFGTDSATFCNESPGVFGRDYTYNSEPSVRYFCSKGATLLRIPIRWERIQPRLGQSLDELELARLRVLVGWAAKHRGRVIIDVHNFGRYTMLADGRPRSLIIDQECKGQTPVSRHHFADLWRRLALAFHDEPAVQSFGLMNEPHDMGVSNWHKISQVAVDAIRATGDTRQILVAGNDWSKAHRFAAANGPKAWIRDPADNIAYEAHCYFDRDGSGRYEKSYDQEAAGDSQLQERGEDRLRDFSTWCENNRVKGFIGEYAVPGNDPRWLQCLENFQSAMRAANMDGCYWAGGEWWGNYPLSIQPSAGFTQGAKALRVLMNSSGNRVSKGDS